MKKLLSIVLFIPLVYSCTKERVCDMAKPKMMVTIEATADNASRLTMPDMTAEFFSGLYRKSFIATQPKISVNLHSEIPAYMTIRIYVNDELVAERGGSCAVTDYNLNYDLNQF